MSNIRTFIGGVVPVDSIDDKEKLLANARSLITAIENDEIVSFIAMGIKRDDNCVAWCSSRVPGFHGLKAMGAASWMTYCVNTGEYNGNES